MPPPRKAPLATAMVRIRRRSTGPRPTWSTQQAVDDFMGGAVATHGDDQPIAGGGGIVGSITAAVSLDHLEIEAATGARGGAPFPETTSPATSGRRVEDDERPV